MQMRACLLYSALLRAGMPGFYDKLLQLPLFNVSVKLLDTLAPALRSLGEGGRSPLLQRVDPLSGTRR
jgi:hypothetical protein